MSHRWGTNALLPPYHKEYRKPKCIACNPDDCRMTWVYVVSRPALGLHKIGIAFNVAKRMVNYRKQFPGVEITVVGKFEGGCRWRALDKEERAHNHLDKKGVPQAGGDWYACDEETALDALRRAGVLK